MTSQVKVIVFVGLAGSCLGRKGIGAPLVSALSESAVRFVWNSAYLMWRKTLRA